MYQFQIYQNPNRQSDCEGGCSSNQDFQIKSIVVEHKSSFCKGHVILDTATFTLSAHVRRQSLPVWPPTLNKMPLPLPFHLYWIFLKCSTAWTSSNTTSSSVWVASWENQPNTRKFDFEMFPSKCSPLAKLLLVENRTKKSFETTEWWQFEVTPYIGPVHNDRTLTQLISTLTKLRGLR